MGQRVEVVQYGRPSFEALAASIAHVRAEAAPLEPITVIVASNFAGLAARRMLGRGTAAAPGGVANVAFVTPLRLVERLGPPTGRRRLSNPLLGAAVRQALEHHDGPFREVRQHHATESAIASLYGELSHCSPSSLDRIAETSRFAADTVALHRAVAARLD